MRGALKGLGGLVVLLAASLIVVGARQRPDTRLPPGAAGTHVSIAGIPVRYVQSGQGPDLLLLHGSPGSVEDWSPLFDRLADRFRITAFDRPGHGYSGGADLSHTPEENARMTLEVVRALNLRDVVLVGHSYGGVTGLFLATRAPEEIRAFVLVGARAYGPVRVEGLYRLLAVPLFGEGFAAAAGPFVGPRQVESGIRASFGPNVDLIPPGFVAERTSLWTRPTVTTTLSRERVTFEAALEALRPRYAEIRKPLFLVCGEADTRNYEDAKRLAREVPGARLVSLPGTGHYVQFARPDDLVRVIEEAAAAP